MLPPQLRTSKPSGGWCRAIGINVVAFAAHLCQCGCFAYIPPMLLKAGFSEEVMTGLLGVGPFLCLLAVPTIGSLSDVCQSRLGRRRPFILFFGFLTIISLICISYSNGIGMILPNGTKISLALGTVLLDFSSQTLLNPCQALISDLLPSTDIEFGFIVYSFMLSLGGCFGYLLSSMDWTTTSIGQAMGGQEKAVFDLMMVVFVGCLACNFFMAKEVPFVPKDVIVVEKNGYYPPIKVEEDKVGLINGDLPKNGWIKPKGYRQPDTPPHKSKWRAFRQLKFHPGSWKKLNMVESLKRSSSAVGFFMCDLFCRVFISIPTTIATWLHWRGIVNIPNTLRKLFIFQLLGWMGVMSHFMFFTDFCGEIIYNGKPSSSENSIRRTLYDAGVRMGSWGLLLHCVSASVYATMFQGKITQQYGQKFGLIFGLAGFTISMAGFLVAKEVNPVLIMCALTGLGSAALDSIPFSLASIYCSQKEEYFSDSKNEHGIGECLAVLDAAEYLSQVILSLFMGYMFHLTGTVAAYVIVAVACGLAACHAALFIVCPSEKLQSSNA